MSAPKQITAGATILFSESLFAYPATLYTLVYVLNLNGALVAKLAAAASGNDFLITATAETTANWTPGRYNHSAIVTCIADETVIPVWNGQVQVLPNMGISTPQTPAQTQLASLDASITKLLAGTIKSATINGQSWTKNDLKTLFDIRDRLQTRVDAELRAIGLSRKGGSKTIVTRFCS